MGVPYLGVRKGGVLLFWIHIRCRGVLESCWSCLGTTTKTHNFARVPRTAEASDYRGLNSGPLITFTFEGAQNLTTHLDLNHYAYDDLYGYSLGFLQGQGLDPSWMQNSSYWISLSKQSLYRVEQRFSVQHQFKVPPGPDCAD